MKKCLVLFYCVIFILCMTKQSVILFAQPTRKETQQEKFPEEVLSKVLFFVNSSSVSYYGKSRFGGWNVYVFIGQNGELIHVDEETKEVSLVIYKLKNISTQQRISIEEAKNIVIKWLTERKIQLKEWMLEEQGIYKAGNLNRYQFKWVKKTPKGIYLPCLLSVNIMDNGEILSFSRIERPVTISLEPKVSEEEAIKVSLKEVKQKFEEKLTQFRLINKKLFVWFHHNTGKQQLYWEIELEGIGEKEPYKHHNRVNVRIDAHTGEIIAMIW